MTERPRILCVDDEPSVLDGLRLILRKRYDVHTALNANEALAALSDDTPFAVVLSDMRMPGMNGAQLLSEVRQHAPTTVRMLLTGHSDLNSAIAAINEGRIFRFLLKPCQRNVLLNAFEVAVTQHNLASAEKVLLEQTLRGAVEALSDLLALSSPLAAARGGRVRELVNSIADRADIGQRWELDLAAMLSHVGSVTLDPSTAERFYSGETLQMDEQRQVNELPAIAARLLEHIPRMEGVVQIVKNQTRNRRRRASERFTGIDLDRYHSAMILKVANDFEDLVARGALPAQAVGRMQSAEGVYEPAPLRVIADITGGEQAQLGLAAVNVTALEPGMVLAEDLRMSNGMLLVAKGCRVTRSLVAKIDNLWSRMNKQIVHIQTTGDKAA